MLDVIAQTHPLRWSQFDAREMPAGSTLAEIVSALDLDPRFGEPVVTLMRGGRSWEVDASLWRVVRPAEGTRIDVGYRVQGAAVLGVLGSAFPAVAYTVGAFGPVGYALTVAAINVVLGLAFTALVTPPPQDFETPTGTQRGYTISGTRNRPNRYGPVPMVIGRHRFAPPVSVEGRAFYRGLQTYYRTRLCLGWGPLAVEDIRIGDTPLWHFRDVAIDFINVDYTETRAIFGYARTGDVQWFYGTNPGRLYPRDTQLEQVGANLPLGLSQVRVTAPDTYRATVQISFPQGLRYVKDEGDTRAIRVTFHVFYRPAATGGSWIFLGDISQRSETYRPIFIERSYGFPSSGQWEVRVQRVYQDDEGPFNQHVYDANWDFMVSEQQSPDGPRALPAHPNVAELAIQIKASEEVSGALDNIQVTVQGMASAWDPDAGWLPPTRTRNVAWNYLKALRGPHSTEQIPDEEIDLPAFKKWADERAALAVDMVVDGKQRLGDVLDTIAPCGLGRRGYVDGLHSIIREPTDPTPRQIITPHNSWNFSMQIDSADELHGVRAQFINPNRDWTQQELTVYLPEFNASNATKIETLQLPGIVETGSMWRVRRLAMYFLQAAARRRETFTVTMEIEHMSLQRGQVVELVNDAVSLGVASARVGEVLSATLFRPDDRHNLAEGQDYLIMIRRSDGDLLEVRARWESGAFIADAATPLVDVHAGDLISVYERTEERQLCVVTAVLPDTGGNAEIKMKPLAFGIDGSRSHALAPFEPVVSGLPKPLDPAIPDRPKLNFMRSDESSVMDDGRTPRILVRLDVPNRLFPQPTVDRLQLRWRNVQGDAWVLGEPYYTSDPAPLTGPVSIGETYAVEAQIERLGVVSGWESFGTVKAQAHRDPPETIVDLEGVQSGGTTLLLRWKHHFRKDYVRTLIRHSPDPSASWDEAAPLVPIPPEWSEAYVPEKPGIYYVRRVNADGKFGGFSTFTVSETSGDYLVLATYTKHAPFDGTQDVDFYWGRPTGWDDPGQPFEGDEWEVVDGALQLAKKANGTYVDPFRDYTFVGVNLPTEFDLASTYTETSDTARVADLSVHVGVGWEVKTLDDAKIGPGVNFNNLRIGGEIDVRGSLEARSAIFTRTGTRASPSDYRLRSYDHVLDRRNSQTHAVGLAIRLGSGDARATPSVRSIWCEVRAPKITREGTTASLGPTFNVVWFFGNDVLAFITKPSLMLRIVDPAAGDRIETESQAWLDTNYPSSPHLLEKTGFVFRVVDSSGNPKIADVEWTAVGYGKRQ